MKRKGSFKLQITLKELVDEVNWIHVTHVRANLMIYSIHG